MEQHRLHWALPPCGSQLTKEECADDVSRQEPILRSFTVSRESCVHKRADLQIRLEFMRPQFREESSTNL
jgi:hypothetical protein